MTQYSHSYTYLEFPSGDISDLQWRTVRSLQKAGYQGVQIVEDHPSLEGPNHIPGKAINFHDGFCEFWIWHREGEDSQHFSEYAYITCTWGIAHADWELDDVLAKLHHDPDLGVRRLGHFTYPPRPLPGYEG
ncbi:hypothetical protein BAGA_28670 [Bacillus gaemokensis]|uniref:Uncharacterized protein n=1 Tax=Bacillus gaemokensis TaxID=574375 RepID=A0A073K4V9_9BACI|nr:hypothetical protein BAGA_28670 [Bacillus gaemokensis]KYG30734.1 hypothetical protein AZF08_27600 [Bacillus gaemokensis]